MMTDEAKALVDGDHNGSEQTFRDTERNLRDLIKTQAREIERLRGALEAYAARCTICSGGGSIAEEDSVTGAYLWRDCPGCTPARAALAGDSHE